MANEGLKKTAKWLVIVGAIAWGGIGLMDKNLVTSISFIAPYAKWIYIAVGAAGVYLAYEEMK